jgi:tellurite resistance protein TerC
MAVWLMLTLNYGLAGVLVFIGVKMLIADVWKVPIGLSLGMVALLIGASLVASRFLPRTD